MTKIAVIAVAVGNAVVAAIGGAATAAAAGLIMAVKDRSVMVSEGLAQATKADGTSQSLFAHVWTSSHEEFYTSPD